MREMINVTRSYLPEYSEYCEEIRGIWDSHWLTNMGDKHKELESKLKEHFASPNIKLFTNGHLALEAAIEALGLSGEIITTPFTFASTTHAIVRCGCTPVFCDINPSDFTIDVTKIEGLITPKTSAILPVHVYGNLCDVEAIQRIADKYHLKVIYDAAHAFGVEKNGINVAGFGDISMFSFHATKVFHTIEGGALTYNDESLGEIIDDIKNFGIRGPEAVEYAGGNAKMNEFQAAMGLCVLRHMDEIINKRKIIVNHYNNRLQNVSGILHPRSAPDVTPNYAYYPILFDGFVFSRDEVFNILKEHGIIARKYFFPLTNNFACYTKNCKSHAVDNTPIAHHVAENVITLPLYPDLTIDQVDYICDLILSLV